MCLEPPCLRVFVGKTQLTAYPASFLCDRFRTYKETTVLRIGLKHSRKRHLLDKILASRNYALASVFDTAILTLSRNKPMVGDPYVAHLGDPAETALLAEAFLLMRCKRDTNAVRRLA